MAKVKQEASIEKQLGKAANKLRKNIDAAEYKHVVMGLVFLKYISNSFEKLYNSLKAEEEMGADREDRDEHKAENVFFVPPITRWSFLLSNAKLPNIGKIVDEVMYFVPSKDKMKVMDEQIVLLMQKLENNTKQIQTLENLRDTLLPKLMSGEVRVKV
ncbi:MAG: type I restriction-modification system subunit M N-terminal domain-containing protein [Sulfurovum sp.]|nr:type I restriction-modification system subunit M N-terminal domain-containing protein [Sulfurovum sp.]MCB4763507.1 type I restriction-modification system subunit M N-terminal domain-containing protein [Sulfurovum sp.]MCB4773298.1 type I restriction-modification system subunit M N-terminal domain-containing protein [Sulfurovum sp.]MCB4782070.1 type I restriction-modification system subunit M N-terminal domain-containing protein [Sulfurovum sp.]